MTKVGAEWARKFWVIHNVENHQILALKMLFFKEKLPFKLMTAAFLWTKTLPELF